jgi:hypothetical protein
VSARKPRAFCAPNAPASRSKTTLVLQLAIQGYVPRELEIANVPGTEIGCDLGVLALEPGEVFTGRVLGLLESAAVDVGVYLVSADDLRRLQGTRTNSQGEYSLPMPLPGMYHLHARAEDQGAAVLADVELPPFGDPVLPDILLRGDGLLTASSVHGRESRGSGSSSLF